MMKRRQTYIIVHIQIKNYCNKVLAFAFLVSKFAVNENKTIHPSGHSFRHYGARKGAGSTIHSVLC